MTGAKAKPSVGGSGAGSAALPPDPSLPDAVEDLLGALRHVQLAESTSPAPHVAELLAAGRRVQRTLSRIVANDSLWSTLGAATAEAKLREFTPEDVERARERATDHLTRAMHQAGHTPPPPGHDIVHAVVQRIRLRDQTPQWLSNQPRSMILATRMAMQDLHDEMADVVRQAQPLVAAGAQTRPDGAAASELSVDGPGLRSARDRSGVTKLRALLTSAKTPLLCLAASTALFVPPLVTADEPAEAIADLSVNLAAGALAASAASAWRLTEGPSDAGTAGAPRQDPPDVASPTTSPTRYQASADLSQRREEARVRVVEALARRAAAEADEAEARVRKARAEADKAEQRAQERKSRPLGNRAGGSSAVV